MSALLIRLASLALGLLWTAPGLPVEPIAPAAPRPVAADSVEEYALKAAFLYQFANYTTWPDEAFQRDDSPIVIAVLGKDPFGDALKKTLKDRTLGGRALKLVHFAELEDLEPCHLLFVSRSHASHQHKLRTLLKEKPTFTASDIDGFASNGGIAELSIVDLSLKMTINVGAMRRAKLEVSSQMLKLATLIDEDADR